MEGGNSNNVIDLCSSDEEIEIIEIIKIIDSHENEIIVIGSESEDSGKGGEDISGPIRTTTPGDITRNERFSTNFGIKRFNGRKECDWAASNLWATPKQYKGTRESYWDESNLWATPKRTKVKIGSLQKTCDVARHGSLVLR